MTGLHQGDEIAIEYRDGKIEIEPKAAARTLKKSGKYLVIKTRRFRAPDVSPLDCLQAMQNVELASLAGGKVYDAAIVECAVHCGASLMLTFDAGDYSRVRPPALEIAIPE
jgi:hypothetical protein